MSQQIIMTPYYPKPIQNTGLERNTCNEFSPMLHIAKTTNLAVCKYMTTKHDSG